MIKVKSFIIWTIRFIMVKVNALSWRKLKFNHGESETFIMWQSKVLSCVKHVGSGVFVVCV